MQSLGGCRAVLLSVRQVRGLVETYRQGGEEHEFLKESSTSASPWQRLAPRLSLRLPRGPERGHVLNAMGFSRQQGIPMSHSDTYLMTIECGKFLPRTPTMSVATVILRRQT